MMSDTTEAKPKIPANALPKLRDTWLRAFGAAQAAEAAKQVSEQMYAAYQTQMNAYLDMLGLDSTARWWLDFTTGEISDTPPPEQQGQNGVAN